MKTATPKEEEMTPEQVRARDALLEAGYRLGKRLPEGAIHIPAGTFEMLKKRCSASLISAWVQPDGLVDGMTVEQYLRTSR